MIQEDGRELKMDERNCEILTNYLKSILYDKEISRPDVEKLEGPFRELALYMEALQKDVEELRAYSEALSLGNLSQEFPSQDNKLCENLRCLHENLNDLTWQAKQVAAGDYSQHIPYMGEFSEAFNSIIRQLEAKETLYHEETKKLHAHAEVVESYNDLLMEMTRRRHERVIVVDALNHKVVYCNRSVNNNNGKAPLCDHCKCRADLYQKIMEWNSEGQWAWEFSDERGNCFSINSFPVEWRGRESFVHIISDVTKQRHEKDVLENKVYYDAAFGIRNFRFFKEYMETVLAEKKTVTLCYLDLDGLKSVNDHFGHLEGDEYIRAFVDVVHRHIRRGDILARVGGDEFFLVLTGNLEQLAHDKMEGIRDCFRMENRKSYPVSFSYGIYVLDGETNTRSLEDIIKCVDASMYEYKREYKKCCCSSK